MKPHEPPVHVAVALAGGMHGAQPEPQLFVDVSDRQLPPQSWKPVLHAIPQKTPPHVGDPFGTLGQAVQLVPHVAVDVFDTQAPPQL